MTLSTLKQSLTVADQLIFLIALILLGGLYGRYWIPVTPADYALILVAQQPPQRVNLKQAQLIHVHGHLGESVLEIAGGRIRFHSSPCQNKLCIYTGWLQKSGDFAVCLPNQVSIQLQGVQTNPFDAIVY